jgi:hypothetical protein
VSLLEVRDPATETVIARLEAATATDADAAVERAAAAFEGWRAVAPADRARLLRRLAERLDGERERLAQLEMRNTGKPIADARGELGMVVDTFAYYAGAPERLLGDTIPVAGGVDLTFREPLGVVGLIVPWNFPPDDRLLEAGRGAGRRQYGGPQAGRADPADRPGLCRAGRRGRHPRRGGQRARRARPGGRPAAGRASAGGQDRLHRPDRGRAGHRDKTVKLRPR